MFKWILLILLSLNSFALEISMDSAKDDFSKYSILHLINNQEFVCQEIKNDFEITTEIICAFSKKPSQKIKLLQNEFFKIKTFIKKGTFFISIKPFYKIYLIADIFNLYKADTIYKANVTMSDRWIILGYKDKLPLINNKNRPGNSINFPFFMDQDKLPYVGSLDIKGNPVYIKKVADVTEYLKVKRYYKEKKYALCMGVIDDILSDYPNTLFKAELIHYKIDLYNKLKDYDSVIENAKIFLREYSSDENIPEVLSLIAKAYSEIGMNVDADYFFDRLFSEHKNSVHTEWGHIYKGEMFEENGGVSKAINSYKKVLYKTDNIDVAVSAAYHLALVQQEYSLKKAAKYIDKIVKSKPSYLMKKYKNSKIMMHNFADENDFETASSIALALLNSMNVTHDDYETLLSQRALWLSQTASKKEALIALNRYIKQFPDGDFIEKIDIAKDALFFETSDLNATKKLNEYDKLMKEYANDTIGNRAIYEKAKLLLKEQMYSKVIKMRDELLKLDTEQYKDVEQIIKDGAVGAMKQSLEDKECKEVLIISDEYNITLSNKWDDGIYGCAMKGGIYQLSKSIASKHLKSKDLDLRKKWLYRYIKVDFSTGNYSDVIDASRDLITLIEDDKKSKYRDVYRYIFDTYDRLEQNNKMLNTMAKIDAVFGLDYKDIERYVSVMSVGNETNDDNIVIKYASKVMSIQKSSHSTAQSPYVEFTLYQSYMNKENYNKAFNVIKLLDSVKIDKKSRSRQKYLLGTVLSKLWRNDEANEAYKASIKADPKSAWAKLAQSAKSI